jgi:hypothetical protein
MEREIFKMQGHEDVAEQNHIFLDEWSEYERSEGKRDFLEVTLLTYFRDGGTIVIETNRGIFFGDKKTGSIHTAHPTEDNNKLEDDFFRRYLINLVSRKVYRLKEDARWEGVLFERLNKA